MRQRKKCRADIPPHYPEPLLFTTKMIKVAIVGYGNIGKYAVDALRAAPDMELAGIVRRPGSEAVHGIKTVSDVEELGHVDAALLCTPTRSVEETALPLLARGVNTVDSFDIHGDIVALRRSLGAQAIKHDAVSIISAGWDPGTTPSSVP